MLVLAAFAAVAACFGAEYRIEAFAMNQAEGSAWTKHCSGTNGSMWYSPKKGNKLNATYVIPEAGKYFVWVRTQTNNQNWRKVQVSFTAKNGGKCVGKAGDKKIAGFTKPRLYWEKLLLPLTITEANEEVKVEVTDVGGNSRIDCIILTTNPDYTPSDKDADILDVDELENAE